MGNENNVNQSPSQSNFSYQSLSIFFVVRNSTDFDAKIEDQSIIHQEADQPLITTPIINLSHVDEDKKSNNVIRKISINKTSNKPIVDDIMNNKDPKIFQNMSLLNNPYLNIKRNKTITSSK